MTRDEGLARLATFLAGPAAQYAHLRNTDRGRDGLATTSVLSPYLRRRLLTEQEVALAAVDALGPRDAEKFVSEIFWRTYFKGHLETHPQVWTSYLAGLRQAEQQIKTASSLQRSYQQAIEGRTGIDGFDEWIGDLVATGWLHNHTRMWVASIWIFTLRLPWELGAAFFLQHLVDGDPASNTLSWRWVAGLHTRGKHYVARRDNIRRFTEGRYDPHGLNEDPASLEESQPPQESSMPCADAAPEGDVALLLHLDDLHPESLPLGRSNVRRIAGLIAHIDGADETVQAVDREAMADTLQRAQAHFNCPGELVDEGWSAAMPIVTAYAPVGPSANVLPPGCLQIRRRWDDAAWPLSNRGYAKVRAAIPGLIAV